VLSNAALRALRACALGPWVPVLLGSCTWFLECPLSWPGNGLTCRPLAFGDTRCSAGLIAHRRGGTSGLRLSQIQQSMHRIVGSQQHGMAQPGVANGRSLHGRVSTRGIVRRRVPVPHGRSAALSSASGHDGVWRHGAVDDPLRFTGPRPSPCMRRRNLHLRRVRPVLCVRALLDWAWIARRRLSRRRHPGVKRRKHHHIRRHCRRLRHGRHVQANGRAAAPRGLRPGARVSAAVHPHHLRRTNTRGTRAPPHAVSERARLPRRASPAAAGWCSVSVCWPAGTARHLARRDGTEAARVHLRWAGAPARVRHKLRRTRVSRPRAVHHCRLSPLRPRGVGELVCEL